MNEKQVIDRGRECVSGRERDGEWKERDREREREIKRESERERERDVGRRGGN